MRRWRRLAIVGLLLWAAAVLLWAGRSWKTTIPLKAPTATPQSAEFRCGSPLGGSTDSSLLSPRTTSYAVSEAPCGQRTARRNLAYVDAVGAGLIVLVLLRGETRHKRAAASPDL